MRTTKLLLSATLGLSFLGASLSTHAQDKPLRIGWVYALGNAPAVIADRKGFFREEGVNVEIKSFGDGPVVQQALSSGELDMAYIGVPPVYQWYARGLNSRILAKVNYGQAAVITQADSKIKEVKDLKGGKIAGIAKGSGMDVLLRGYVLKEASGLEPDRDINVVSMPAGNMTAALDRNLVDAAFTWEPFISTALLRGTSRVVLDVNKAIPQYPWYIVMGMPRTLAQRPDDVLKVLRAHHRAIDFLNKHPDEANRILAEAFEIAPVKTADGREIAPVKVIEEARKRIGWSDRIENSDLQFIQRLINYSRSLGFLNKDLKATEFIDTSWQQRAVQAPAKPAAARQN
ncbi:MAG: ABC transporter substrate-binding protein [Oxalicibacterium faecigallinarum]|uniref:ABC transporter substrate-binding protein n=1 Tax=Oxalicibacterium faecigallinarum TaxID=573741 RepID=UPI0028073111|nr:ABC transporter substrate-binding protein [Oxalicibacterium faecigallinarum]MDQ7968863.1 ABC transporter substrate-binding protein [Oxalicibacterium faecigallinarum]